MSSYSEGRDAQVDRELAGRLRRAIRLAFDGDAHLQRRGRHLETRCLIQIGTERLLLEIHAGRPTIAEQIPLLCSWAFAIRADAKAWSALWQPVPAPGSHDVFALYKRGEMQIDGNLQPLMANLQYFKDLVTLPREGEGR